MLHGLADSVIDDSLAWLPADGARRWAMPSRGQTKADGLPAQWGYTLKAALIPGDATTLSQGERGKRHGVPLVTSLEITCSCRPELQRSEVNTLS